MLHSSCAIQNPTGTASFPWRKARKPKPEAVCIPPLTSPPLFLLSVPISRRNPRKRLHFCVPLALCAQALYCSSKNLLFWEVSASHTWLAMVCCSLFLSYWFDSDPGLMFLGSGLLLSTFYNSIAVFKQTVQCFSFCDFGFGLYFLSMRVGLYCVAWDFLVPKNDFFFLVKSCYIHSWTSFPFDKVKKRNLWRWVVAFTTVFALNLRLITFSLKKIESEGWLTFSCFKVQHKNQSCYRRMRSQIIFLL